jgi:hypothetical protein
MLHHHRTFGVANSERLDELVTKLTEQTWTLCTGFAYQGLLLVNDSFSENGAQEYAVYKAGRQIDSLTVSWMTGARLRDVMTHLLHQQADETLPFEQLQTEPVSAHSCGLCQ